MASSTKNSKLITQVWNYAGRIDKAYFLILGFTIIIHGLLLINDGIYYDTWIIHNYQFEKRWDSLFLLLSDSGRPMMGMVYQAIGMFPNPILATRIYEVLCIFFSGILIYKIGKEFFDLSPLQIIIISLVSVSYPIYYQFSVNMDVYLLYYFVFIFGAYLSFEATKFSGIRHWLLRIVSVILLFVSFDLSSLLVFYLGFYLLFFIYSYRDFDLDSLKVYKRIVQFDDLVIKKQIIKISFVIGILFIASCFMLDWLGLSTPGWLGTNQQILLIIGAIIFLSTIFFWFYGRINENNGKEIDNKGEDSTDNSVYIKKEASQNPGILLVTVARLVYFAITHPIYTVLPIVFWIIKNNIWPTSNNYANYNKINLNFSNYLNIYKDFFTNAIYHQFLFVIIDWVLHPLLFIGAIILGLYLYKRLNINQFTINDGEKKQSWFLFAIGLFLLVLGIFPYAAVGLSPEPSGWDSRHTILLGMPMGIIFAGVLQLQLHKNNTAKNDKIVLSRLGWVIVVVVILGFSQLVIKNYLALQARWVIDRSVMTNLSKHPEYEEYSVFWVDNQFKTYDEIYRFYEWAGIFKKTWGNESHIGLEKRYRAPDALAGFSKYFTKESMLGTFNPSGYQANLTILPGSEGTIENYLSSKQIMSVEYIRYLDESYNNFYLTARYFYFKLLNPKNLDGFLLNVTNVSAN